ncbi:hypothetical protein ACFVU3_28845 [Streptomyces sp. NPDC058052]|uniref:hypothetical protein n=1 Tax=Streptomyces sp. NPDC058052 TaxID=3346316 RepID=UPI0036F0C16B
MSTTPIIVHRYSPFTGPRHAGPFDGPAGQAEDEGRVTARRRGHDAIPGMACSGHDLAVFLDRAAVPAPETAIDDPAWVERLVC